AGAESRLTTLPAWHSSSGCAPAPVGDSNSKTYRNRALWWHCHFWLCSCDPARWGGTAQDGPKPPRHRERFRLRDALPSVCRPPFAASNSRSTPKFRHSLTFPLLLVNAGATLQHGRSSSGASSKVPSSFARRKRGTQTACPVTYRVVLWHPSRQIYRLRSRVFSE